MENTKGKSFPSDISTIRSILMGQEMETYESKFKSIQEQFEAVSQQLADLEQATQMANENLRQTLTEDAEHKFKTLNESLQTNVEQLTQKIEQTSVNDKAEIGKMLIEIGKQLINQ